MVFCGGLTKNGKKDHNAQSHVHFLCHYVQAKKDMES